MKTIVLLSKQDYRFNSVKNRIYTNPNIKVESWGNSYVDLYTDYGSVRIIFKKINTNRPADLYKYSNDTIFVYISGYLKRDVEAIDLLSKSLKKKRDFIEIESIPDFIDFIFNQKVITYYKIDENYDLIKIHAYSYPEYASCQYLKTRIILTDDYDKAVAHRDEYIRIEMDKVAKEIEAKANELQFLSSKLSN